MPDDIAEVYRNTYPALVRFLYRKVWDAERAADLAQEAFSRALVHRPENTRGWLFVVAANMARDGESLLLWDAGMSYDEIAAQTGLARGAIGTTLARARRRLVEAYDAGQEGGEHVARG